MTMQIRSEAFGQSEMIPIRFTCKGENISPPLEWVDVPEGVRSFVLVCDDPDAPMGTWVHWVIFNIPGDCRTIPENMPNVEQPASGGVQGANSWGRIGYSGPCPPSGMHRYFFRLYALNSELSLGAGASKARLLKEMEGRVLAECELMGRYAKH